MEFSPRAVCTCFAIAYLAATASPPARGAGIVWENEFADEQVISNGTQVTAAGGLVVTFATTVVSDSDGGTFDLTPQAGNADYVTAESSPLGNHPGLVQLGFDNQNNDPADYVELTLTFSDTLFGLNFVILDVDSSGGTTWDDGVLFTYNGGTNILSDPSLYSLPGGAAPTVLLDNEPGYDGFEGWNGRTATNGEVTGNVGIDFGTVGVNDVTIRYFSTNDAQANPAGQRIGISDLVWLVPEPSTGASLGLGLAMLSCLRRRSRRL